MNMHTAIVAASLALVSGVTLAAPVLYNIDPNHTYPSFEADHRGGLSIWRGKFNKSSGTITLDREARAGSIDITIDAASIDFGHELMNQRARSAEFFDVEKFPTATYKGRFSRFNGDAPGEVQGELTLHGVTRAVTLTIHSFMCKIDVFRKTEVCGADASAAFSRADFGINYGYDTGVKQDVKILIQVEAFKAE